MSSIIFRSTHRPAAALCASVLALGLTAACGSNSAVPVAAGTSASASGPAGPGGDTAALNALIAAEQSADPAALAASPAAASIKSRGKLMVGGSQTAALFSLLDPTTGKVTGFDAALSQLLAKYIIGRPDTQLVNVTSATREALLQNHSVDAVFATYTITAARASKVGFAGPYYLDGLALMVRKDTKGISSLSDLAGKTVVTETGSTATNVIKQQAPGAKIQLFDTNTECLQALQQGRADAYFLDQGILAGDASKNADVKVLPGTFSQEPYGIGVPLDQPDFKAFVNDWLKKIEADGTWAKVWKATVGTTVPGDAPAPPQIG
jgi:glutamate transport system substrate-binding protein